MKQAKMMLSALAVVAILGGAFAFKAKNAFGSHIYTGIDGMCTTLLQNATIGGSATQIYASTHAMASWCPLNHTIANP